MNRTERRKKEREAKKLKGLEKKEVNNIRNFIDKLTPKQVQVINNYINSEIAAGVKEEVEYRTKCLDTTFTAAMICKTDYSIEEINSIFKYSFELLEELESKDKKLRKEYKERYFNYMTSQEKEIEIACEELIKNGAKQKEAIEELSFKFPKIAKANLSNAFRNVKKNYLITDKEAEDKLREVLNIKENETTKEMLEEIIGANKEIIEVDKDMVAAKTTLKIKRIAMEVEGEHGGTYTVDNGKVIVGGFTFNTRKDFEMFVQEATEVFNLADKH